jgi:hypothetical protein
MKREGEREALEHEEYLCSFEKKKRSGGGGLWSGVLPLLFFLLMFRGESLKG